MSDQLDLTRRVAVITGGGTRIRAATAHFARRARASVVIAARTVEDPESTSASVEERAGAIVNISSGAGIYGDLGIVGSDRYRDRLPSVIGGATWRRAGDIDRARPGSGA